MVYNGLYRYVSIRTRRRRFPELESLFSILATCETTIRDLAISVSLSMQAEPSGIFLIFVDWCEARGRMVLNEGCERSSSKHDSVGFACFSSVLCIVCFLVRPTCACDDPIRPWNRAMDLKRDHHLHFAVLDQYKTCFASNVSVYSTSIYS